MDSKEEKIPIKRKYRGVTRKSIIIRNRSRKIKLLIKYNTDGVFIGESPMHLTSYLGVLSHTQVPIRYNIPIQLKDNLWDCIEVA